MSFPVLPRARGKLAFCPIPFTHTRSFVRSTNDPTQTRPRWHFHTFFPPSEGRKVNLAPDSRPLLIDCSEMAGRPLIFSHQAAPLTRRKELGALNLHHLANSICLKCLPSVEIYFELKNTWKIQCVSDLSDIQFLRQ